MHLRTLLLALWPLASWGNTYDFDYRTVGDPDARPANVFDDGAVTFFQFAPGRPIPAILKVGPAGEQIATWRIDGPYVVVDGVLADWRLRLGRGIAAVRYAGSRTLGVKGTLYGAAVPISETGVAGVPVVAPVLTTALTTALTTLAAPPVPPPVTQEPVKTLPDFTGSFVVRKLGESTARQPAKAITGSVASVPAALPTAVLNLATVARLRMALSLHPERIPAKPLWVRFKGNGLAGHGDDLEALARDALTRGEGWTIQVLAYSGARSPEARKRWAERRGERVRAALAEAGIDPARVHIVASTAQAKPLALVSFIDAGTRV